MRLARKDAIGLIVAVALLTALPVILKAVERRQYIRTRAQPPGEIVINNGAETTTSLKVKVKLTSPYGQPARAQNASVEFANFIPAAYAVKPDPDTGKNECSYVEEQLNECVVPATGTGHSYCEWSDPDGDGVGYLKKGACSLEVCYNGCDPKVSCSAGCPAVSSPTPTAEPRSSSSPSPSASPGQGGGVACRAGVSKSPNGPWQQDRADYRENEKAWVAVIDNDNSPLTDLTNITRQMDGPSGWRMGLADFSNNPQQTNALGGPGDYVFKVSCPGGQTATAKVIVTTEQARGTRGFKIANSLVQLDKEQERSYTAHPLEIEWDLSQAGGNSQEGEKNVYVKFFRSDGAETGLTAAKITYRTTGPSVSQVACKRDVVEQKGAAPQTGWILTLSGDNFGDSSQKGSVKLGTESLDIVQWSQSSLKLRYAKRQLPTAKTNISVTKQDGKSGSAELDPDKCSRLGKAALHIKSKLQRRLASDQGGDYKVFVRDKDTKKDIHDKKVTFTKIGEVESKLENLTAGELHTVCLKGPQHLQRCKEYTPVADDNTIEFDELLAGDIDGTNCEGDNIINSVDLGIVSGGWSLTSDKDSCADYNRDKRVNSLDWWVNVTNYLKKGDVKE